MHAPINVLANVTDRVRVIERRYHPAREKRAVNSNTCNVAWYFLK